MGICGDRWRIGWVAAGCLLAAWGVCGLGAARAQSVLDGAIGGQVLRADDAPVVAALVTARDVDTGLTLRAVSSARGEFLLVRLPVGEYLVTVKVAGQVWAVPGLVAAGIGEVTEIVARIAPPVAGQPGSAHATSGPQSPDPAMAELPVNSGDVRTLASMVAGANDAGTSEDDASDASFRGMAASQNSSRVDGVSSDDGFSGSPTGAGVAEDTDTGADAAEDLASGVGSGPRSVADGGQRAGSSYAFSSAAVREFRVQGQPDAAAYGSALYGHGVGGVVTEVSRSGGTTLHGMAFYTVRDSAWAAANPFSVESTYTNGAVTSAVVKPLDVRQQFGGRVGGPVPWILPGGSARSSTDQGQKLFYLYAFDAQRRNFPAISAPGYAGFYTLTATQAALLANRGVSAAQTMAALNYLDSLTGTVARRADQTVNFGRLDWQRRGGSRAVLEYNRTRWSNPGGARSGAVVDRGLASIGSSYGAVDASVGRWVQFVTPRLSNEVRVQLGRELQYETAQPPLPQEPAVGPGGMAPEVSIGPDGFVFGTPAALGQRAYPDERRLEVVDVLAWVKGRHFVQLGADFSALSDWTDSLTNAEGTFSYDSGATGGKAGGLVDWITDYTFNVHAYPNGGCPSIGAAVHEFCFRSYSQSFGTTSLIFDTQEWAGFAQDDWRVAPRLTVHAGVRYEYEFLPLPQQPNAALDAVFGATGATSVFPEDRNNVGPRLGFAWQPFGMGRGVVRAGYGVYFGKLPGATVRAALLDTAMPGSTTRVKITPATETACPQVTTVGFGYVCSFLTAPSGVVAATTSAMVFDRRFRLPMVQQANLSLEHELGWGVLGRAEFVTNLDRQLANSVDINIAPSTDVREFQLQGGTGATGARDGETFSVPVYSARVSSSFGPVTDIVSNANATYNGLTLEAQRGLGGRAGAGGVGRGLEFRVAWTWSKALDYGQNAGAVPRTSGQFDPFTVRYDKGLSALNFPERVVATAAWSPRWNSAPGFLHLALRDPSATEPLWHAVLDGWTLAGIFSEGSGRGYSYDVFGGTRLSGGRESINGSGGSAVLPTAGRNTLRLPGAATLDLRLSRSFRVGERLRLRAALEAFNVANRQNLSGVTQRAYLVGTPGTGTAAGVTPLVFQDAAAVASEGLNVLPFGAYTAAATSQARERQVQMGLRLEF